MHFLNGKEKSRVIGMALFLLIVAASDWVWLTAIYGFSNYVLNRPAFNQHLSSGFGIQEEFYLDPMILGVVLLLIILVVSCIRALGALGIVRLCCQLESSVSARMVGVALQKPYIWHIRTGHSQIQKTILSEVNVAIFQGLLPTLTIVGHVFSAIAIVIALVLIDFYVAISAAIVLLILYCALHFLTKPMLTGFGLTRSSKQAQKYKLLSEFFRGIKTVKLERLERRFHRSYVKTSEEYAAATFRAKAAAVIPKYLLEGFVFAALIASVTMRGGSSEDILSVGSVVFAYAMAAYRLMPAAQQIFMQKAAIEFSIPAIDEVTRVLEHHSEGQKRSHNEILPDDFRFRSLELQNVAFRYFGDQAPIFNDVSLTLENGFAVGVIGRSGSGKSTLVDLISGIVQQDSGNILVNGVRVSQAFRSELFSYAPQSTFIFDDSLENNIIIGREGPIDYDRMRKVLGVAQLNEVAERLRSGESLGEDGMSLSGGERQRVGIARALYRDAPILILDEATSALDAHTEEVLIRELFESGLKETYIIIAHRLDSLKRCDIFWHVGRRDVVTIDSLDDDSHFSAY